MAEGTAASAGAPPHHRRTYLVDRSFQLRFALLLAAAGVALALFCGIWLHQAHAQATELLPLDAEARALVARSDHELLGALIGITLLMALALGVIGVVLTHRVAGPILVLRRHLGALARGELPRVRALRRGDELKGLVQTLADAVETLRARERQHADQLEQAIAAMRLALPRAPELQPALAALEAAARERHAALSGAAPRDPTS